MSSATIERILDEVKRLSPDELRELREALDRESQSSAQSPATENRREIERRWIDEHRDEYLGQWVALEGARLLASGEDARAVYSAARASGVHAPFVMRVEPRDDLPFGGW